MSVTKMPWETLGEQFVTQYYQIFDTNREQLVALYHPTAMFTFEEHKAQGQDQIKDILTNKLRFSLIQHIVTKIDCQPTPENGVIILVTGRLKTDNDPPHAYSQLFYIKPANDSFFLFHDIFRLSIHDTV
ncbi:hypothetical protein NP493_119g08015 [Ridgeia piscesae]|uniref:Nuclear transport factor 2 n=1 Tax=Ridgeia piscesae TaxID=27915 RepID=A0AAD9UGX5_RIDPI|nr:hypothetical protein NP493_119g08015 [Ridgeia piscesae]